MTMLRLPAEVKDVFFERIGATLHPKRVEKVRNAITEMRHGSLNDSRFSHRMRGSGKRWSMIEQLFAMHARRLGLNQRELTTAEATTTFRRPTRQLSLFEG
jgi:DNA repair photolyase